MKYLGFFLCLLITACATPINQQQANTSWQLRKVDLAKIQQWRLNARAAVYRDDEYWSINLRWRQKPGSYVINFSAPLNSGQVQLIGEANQVSLRDSAQQIFYADQPETLLLEHTGIDMPVASLRYWILGMPDPGATMQSEVQLDQQGRLTQLMQNGWNVTFEEYTQVNQIELPEEIMISRGDVTVRLIIHRWQLSS